MPTTLTTPAATPAQAQRRDPAVVVAALATSAGRVASVVVLMVVSFVLVGWFHHGGGGRVPGGRVRCPDLTGGCRETLQGAPVVPTGISSPYVVSRTMASPLGTTASTASSRPSVDTTASGARSPMRKALELNWTPVPSAPGMLSAHPVAARWIAWVQPWRRSTAVVLSASGISTATRRIARVSDVRRWAPTRRASASAFSA